MENRVLKVLMLVVGIGLAMIAGILVGGGLVYALVQGTDILPVVGAQEAEDPGYGLVVAAVAPGGPAEEAGIARGDILLEVDGEILENALGLSAALEDLEPDSEVTLAVLHGDDRRALQATLGERLGRAYLGVSLCADPDVQWSVDALLVGARVVEVLPDTPAAQAGLQTEDVILSVDGQPVDWQHTLTDRIAQYAPGDQVTLSFMRPGEEEKQVTVELGAHPDDPDTAYLGVRYAPTLSTRVSPDWPFPHEGFDFDFGDFEFSWPDTEVHWGARVEEVDEESSAFEAGLTAGDVITAVDGEGIDGPLALNDAITGHKPGDEATVTVFDPDTGEEREIQVTLGMHPDKEGTAYLGVRTSCCYLWVEGLDELHPPFGYEIDPDRRFHFMPLFEGLPWGELPFDLDELERHFEFHWSPGGDNGDDNGRGSTDA